MRCLVVIVLLTLPSFALAETTYLHCSGTEKSGKKSARAVTLIKEDGKVYMQWGRGKPREMRLEGDFYKWREHDSSGQGQAVTLNRITKTFAHSYGYKINGVDMWNLYTATCAITAPL